MMISSRVAVIGAGVSGLTCAKLLAESGYDVTIFAAESGDRTTSSAAAAIWYLYDVAENDLVVDWAFATYNRLCELARDPESGVSMIEFRCYGIEAPAWTSACEYRAIDRGFSVRVPLMDTQRYLDYLRRHVTIRVVPPFPHRHENGEITIAEGRQGVIVNVFTEPEWRRRGIAKQLMKKIIAWSRKQSLDDLVLHASDDGRALYEQLGFVLTNEMRLGR